MINSMIFSKTEALNILKASTEAEVTDQYEQLIFDWKQKYLREIPAVAVIKAHQKKITRLNDAMLTFGIQFDANSSTNAVIAENLSLMDYLSAYQQSLMPVKLGVSNASNGVMLIQQLDVLIKLEESLLLKLSNYGLNLEYDQWSAVKLSHVNAVFSIQKELLEKGLQDSEILDYLRNEIKNNTFPFESNLLNSVLKGVKYFQ